MKTFTKIFLFSVTLIISLSVFSQADTLAYWDFENATKRAAITDDATFGSAPYTADKGIPTNKDIAFLSKNGPVYTAWVGGSGGTGTFAPNANTWTNGAGLYYWQIIVNTVGYEDIIVSSKQFGSNTGPRDFQIQYSLDGIAWTDVGVAYMVAGAWTTGVIDDLALPAACDNQTAVYIRWLMTSNTSIGGGTVANTGTNRIDDILVEGTAGTFGNNATIAPNAFIFNIDQPLDFAGTITWNDASSLTLVRNLNVPPDTLVAATDYILDVDTLRIFTSYFNTQFTSTGQQHLIQLQFDAGNHAVVTITWDDDSIYAATLNPDTAYFDLSVPGDVTTTITWNDANNVVQIIDDQGTPYTLLAADYDVTANILTIRESYLSGVLTAPGQTINLNIEFDQGDDVVFTIQSMASPPGPVVIAEWNFEDGVKRAAIADHAAFMATPYTADDGIAANINNSPVLLYGGNSFTGWVAGSAGTGSFAPNTNNWNDGQGMKYWQVDISTAGYGELTLSSKQRSSATGPADFNVEYSINGTDWFAVPGSDFVCGENFTSGVLAELPLPLNCNNRNQLFLRWIMTSNTAVNASPVSTTGTNRIDDIVIQGRYITDEADIVDFSFAEQTGPAVIDPVQQTVDIEVLYGTDLTQLIASFVLSPNATASVGGIAQVNGVTENDFSALVEYLVTAGDGTTTKTWDVTVTTAPASSEAQILDFSFVGYTSYFLDIDNATSTVEIEIYGFDLTNLIAEFELSDGAIAHIGGVLQESGVTENDFTNHVVYTITAQDGTTQRNWTVIVYGYINDVQDYMSSEIKVYPNPSDGYFHVETEAEGRIEIYNIYGALIYSVYADKGINAIQIDHAVQGVYMLHYSSSNRSIVIPLKMIQ